MTRYFYIYKTTCKVNGKIYIGQHISKRLNDSYIGSGKAFRNAVKKYGKENFIKEIIEYCSCQLDLNEREIYHIKQFNSLYPNGYNLTKGGDGNFGWIPSDEVKQKIREAHIGFKYSPEFCIKRSELTKGPKNPNYAKKMSEETKEKIRNSIKGFRHSEETKKKLSHKLKGRKLTDEHKKKISESNKLVSRPGKRGWHHTEETKKKISDKYKARLLLQKQDK